MLSKNLATLSTSELQTFFQSFDTVFCDCDGVLMINNNILPGVNKTINSLTSCGKTIKFVTNNTSMTIAHMLETFKQSRFEHINASSFVTPTIAIGAFLQENAPGKKAFVIGLPALRHDLQQFNIEIANDHLETLPAYTIDALQQALGDVDPEVGAVIICVDFNMTLLSLNRAINYLNNPQVYFIITGNDKTLVWKQNSDIKQVQVCLGAGYVQEIAVNVTQRRPKGFGKPFDEFAQYLSKFMKMKDYDPKRVLFIGDSLEQDIAFAKNLGTQQLLVLTGNTCLDDLKRCNLNQLPDYYIESMAVLNSLIKNIYNN